MDLFFLIWILIIKIFDKVLENIRMRVNESANKVYRWSPRTKTSESSRAVTFSYSTEKESGRGIGIYHEPNPFTALSAWLPSNRWLALPADDDSSRAALSRLYTSLPCVWTAASVRVPHDSWGARPHETAILLFAKTSVCRPRVVLYSWEDLGETCTR